MSAQPRGVLGEVSKAARRCAGLAMLASLAQSGFGVRWQSAAATPLWDAPEARGGRFKWSRARAKMPARRE